MCSAILDVDAYVVEVGAHLYGDILPKFFIVGLPGGALKKIKERVTEAIQYHSLKRQLWLGKINIHFSKEQYN